MLEVPVKTSMVKEKELYLVLEAFQTLAEGALDIDDIKEEVLAAGIIGLMKARHMEEGTSLQEVIEDEMRAYLLVRK